MSPLPSVTFRSELDPIVRKELDQLDSELTAYLLQEHDDDGHHTHITATSLTITGPINERGRGVAQGEWQSYSPIWASSGTQPTVGNGTLVGRYTLIARTCHFELSLTIGTTSGIGTGTYTVSVPLPAVLSVPAAMSAYCHLMNQYRALVGVFASATTMYLLVIGTDNIWDASAPGAPAAGDVFRVNGTYEIA